MANPSSKSPEPQSSFSNSIDKFGFLSNSSSDLQVSSQKSELKRLRSRESKWLEMLSKWDYYMVHHYTTIRRRVRKGIPNSIRPLAWLYLSGAKFQRSLPQNQNVFQHLSSLEGNEKDVSVILKDLHRNFPTHEMFAVKNGVGQTELLSVLKGISLLYPKDGYCQAQAPLAALLLMNMPAEQAFWVLACICDQYIPGYYSPGMRSIQMDGWILYGLLRRVDKEIHDHLKEQGIDPLLVMMEWFLTLYTRSLPWSTVLRIWDMFICEGVKVLFKVAIVLLQFTLTASMRKKCVGLPETLMALKNLSPRVTNEFFLVEQVLKSKLSEKDMEREHRRQEVLQRNKESL